MNVLLLGLLLAVQEPVAITKERVEAVLKDVRPLVEKATGVKFPSKPEFRISTPSELEAILAEELLPQMTLVLPDETDGARKIAAGRSAAMLSRFAMGKFASATRMLHFMPENFASLAALLNKPEMRSAEWLRVVAIHELVHAADEHAFAVMSKIATLKSAEELSIWNALIEGHAQHVTRAILVAERREDLFKDFEQQVTAARHGADEGQRFLGSLAAGEIRFAYVDGRKFFDGVAALGRANYVADLFKAPPASKDVFYNPASYYGPSARKRATEDFSEFLTKLAGEYPEYKLTIHKAGQAELRSGISDFVGAAEADDALRGLIGCQLAIAVLNGGERMITFAIMSMDSPEAAAKMYDVDVKVAKAKDERMKEGSIRIVEAKYGELKPKAAVRHVVVRKRVSVGAVEVPVTTFIACEGTYVMEALYSNLEVTDKEVTSHLEKMVERLKSAPLK